MTVSVAFDEIPQVVADLGLVLGLLEHNGSAYAFRFEWFADAAAELRAVPSRRKELLKLLRDLLGKPIDKPPDDRVWYALPYEGEPSVLHLVLPSKQHEDDRTATFGLGLLRDSKSEVATFREAAYFPLVRFPFDSPPIVLGQNDAPIELTQVTSFGKVIKLGDVSVDGLEFHAKVFFSGSAPSGELFTTNGKDRQSIADTLKKFKSVAVRQIVNAALTVTEVAAWLNQKIGESSITRGDVLQAAEILEVAPPKAAAVSADPKAVLYQFGNLNDLVGKAGEIAATLAGKALEKLAERKEPLKKFGKDGGIWVTGLKAGKGKDYGLRLALPDISFAKAPGVVVQLGKLLTGDSKESSWISRSYGDAAKSLPQPGVTFSFLHVEDKSFAFRPKVDLVSLGLDLAGTKGNPLFNVAGVTVKALEPRFLVSLDFADVDKNLVWGVALETRELGIPLGNGLASSKSNPVAQNLLASGSGDKEAVNPRFTACVGRVVGPKGAAKLDVSVLDDKTWARRIWVPVQRAFGPLQCRRVGLEWPDDNAAKKLHILFDGSVALGPLGIDLKGLSVGMPLDAPGDIGHYDLALNGLGLSYDAPELAISGAFVERTDLTPIEYDGSALIRAAEWTLEAIGSYAVLEGQPSLFIFARLDAELGGPPFFFVTGLCAGFGYNRSLRIPERHEVPSFPLLAGISDPSKIGGKNATPAQALTALADWVAPARGVNWVAAGVQFTSFELVRSNVVVTAIVAKDFQLAILGVSRIKLAQTGPQFAYAELGLEAVLHPASGFLGFSAQLSPNSYVLTEACHLTGGFAFYTWYDGEHSGDFVITLGGYHPAFIKPPHYPDVPRLAFSWQVSNNLTVQGNAYFALTPSCAMGGGALDVQFHSGDLRAWFTARADFLFTWKPFYFIGNVSVSIGASYKVDLWFVSGTVSVELGASLEIWGPPTGGVVHVDWFIISFSVGFGAGKQQPQGFVDWKDFSALLPQPAPSTEARLLRLGAAAEDPVILTTAIARGLVRTRDDGGWVVRGDELTFSIGTAVPATSIQLQGASPKTYTPDEQNKALSVRPMGIASADSAMTVTLRGPAGKIYDLGSGWGSDGVTRGVPASMWGAPLAERSNPTVPSAESLPGRLMGVTSIQPPTLVPKGPDPIPLKELGFFDIVDEKARWLPLSPSEAPLKRRAVATPDSVRQIANSIATTATGARAAIFAALGTALGYDAGANDDARPIAANASLAWPDAPMLGAPWEVAA